VEYWHDPAAPAPNSLVPASGVLAVNDRGEILLQRRRDTGQWAIPMGKQELGETITECAIRETKEETGVDVEITGLVGIFSDPSHIVAYADGEVRQEYEVTLLGRPVGGGPGANARPTMSGGCGGMSWMLSTSTQPCGGRSRATSTAPIHTWTSLPTDPRRWRQLQ